MSMREAPAEERLTEQLSPEQEMKRDQFQTDLASVLDDPSGRRVIFEILGWAGIYADIHPSGGSADYSLGKRKIGLLLMAGIENINPLAYPKMLLQLAEEEAIRAKIENEKDKPDGA